MSYTLDCPVCHEPISIVLVNELEGDGPWASVVSHVEFSEVGPNCGCDLTDDQIDALLESVDMDALIDSYSYGVGY